MSHGRNLYGIAIEAAADEWQSIGRHKQWMSMAVVRALFVHNKVQHCTIKASFGDTTLNKNADNAEA